MKFVLDKIRQQDDLCEIFDCLSNDFFLPFEERNVEKKNWLKKMMTFGEVYAAYTSDGQLAGMMCFYCNDYEREEGYLTTLVIKTEYRRMGLATVMLHELESFCRRQNMKTIRLEVHKKNEAAMELYQKQGWRYQGEAKSDSVYLIKYLSKEEGEMIRISKVDDKLTIYSKGSVVVFGAGKSGRRIFRQLEFFGIDIEGFCDSDENKWGSTFEGKKVLSLEELKALKETGDIVVQIGSCYEREIEKQLLGMGIETYILYTEAVTRLTFLRAKQNMRSPIVYSIKKDNLLDMQFESFLYAYLQKIMSDEGVILCLPPKTGDHIILKTLKKNGISYCNIWHRPYVFRTKLLEELNIPKIKIVTAVRDPIAQNISWMYQMIENGIWYFDLEEYWHEGGDAQRLFETTVIGEKYGSQVPGYACIYDNIMEQCRYMGGFIQNFFASFKDSICDITSYEFDTEKGYQIIHDGKLEIFVYQIEKLDGISSALLDWLGCDTPLVNGNIGRDKWYAESYEKARNGLKFTKEYVEKCYNESCVTHFYNKEDIQRFRERWEKNISSF